MRVQEDSNPHDWYVHKDMQVVGHVARKISIMCYLFLQKGDTISCVFTGTEGTSMICLKEAWKYHAYWSNNDIQKVKNFYRRRKMIPEVPFILQNWRNLLNRFLNSQSQAAWVQGQFSMIIVKLIYGLDDIGSTQF